MTPWVWWAGVSRARQDLTAACWVVQRCTLDATRTWDVSDVLRRIGEMVPLAELEES